MTPSLTVNLLRVLFITITFHPEPGAPKEQQLA